MPDFDALIVEANLQEDPVGWLLEHTDVLVNRAYDTTMLLRMVFARMPQERKDRWESTQAFVVAARERGANA